MSNKATTSIDCADWAEFRLRMDRYLSLKVSNRERFVFRGHARSEWRLETTLQRFARRSPLWSESPIRKMLLGEFQVECARIDGNVSHQIELATPELEMFARHHSLPCSILDWSGSPFVASHFAFESDEHFNASPPERVAIWMLDRSAFEISDAVKAIGDNIALVLSSATSLRNRRASEQNSHFMIIKDPELDIETLLSPFMYKYTIPSSERTVAMSFLDEFGINSRSLFRDYDAAAKTASWRVEMRLSEMNQ